MIKLSDYVNSSGEVKLYRYKVVNLKFKEYLKFNTKTNDLIILEEDGFFSGFLNQSTFNLNEKVEDDRVLFSYLETFNFYTNEKIIEPIFKKNNDFYLFSFKEKNDIDFNQDKFYYLDSNSNVEYDFSDDFYNAENYLFQVSFSNVKALKNYDVNKIEYRWIDSINKKETKTVTITVPNTILISDIVFKGRIEQNAVVTENNVIADFSVKNNVTFYPHILHPINVQNSYVNWFDQTLFFLKEWKSYFFESDYLRWSVFYYNLIDEKFRDHDGKKEIINFANDILKKKLFRVTDTLTSNFANMSEKERKEFKEEVFNGTDPKQYCDFEINTLLNKIPNNELKDIVRLIILMLSKHISSSYCFKGGLTEEHELLLPFYLDKTTDSDEFIVRSNYFYFVPEEHNWVPKDHILNEHNSFLFHNKIIQMPIIPEKINEINISNSPLDFNTSTSHNFNYLFWNPSKSEFISEYFEILGVKPGSQITHDYNLEILMNSEQPFFKTRFSEQPKQKLKILKYNELTKDTSKIFGKNLRDWNSIWTYLEETYPKIKSILKNSNYEVNKGYTESEAHVFRENFETQFFSGPTHNSRGSTPPRGWSLKFSKEKAIFPISYTENSSPQKLIKIDYLFKEANEFKKILNSEKSSEIDITFEIENSDFILEEINLKSIFADQIKVKIDDYLDKNFKLNYENNKLVSETKLII